MLKHTSVRLPNISQQLLIGFGFGCILSFAHPDSASAAPCAASFSPGPGFTTCGSIANNSFIDLDFSGLNFSIFPGVTNEVALQILVTYDSPSGGALKFSNVGAKVNGNSQVFGEFNDVNIAVWGATPAPPSSGVENYSVPTIEFTGAFSDPRYRFASFTLSGPGSTLANPVVSPFSAPLQVRAFSSFKVQGTYLGMHEGNDTLPVEVTFRLNALGLDDSTSDPNDLKVLGSAGGTYRTIPVPAPLPLIGGAFAFAWSRALRKRIKVAQLRTAES
jgi:hypothetical protein